MPFGLSPGHHCTLFLAVEFYLFLLPGRLICSHCFSRRGADSRQNLTGKNECLSTLAPPCIFTRGIYVQLWKKNISTTGNAFLSSIQFMHCFCNNIIQMECVLRWYPKSRGRYPFFCREQKRNHCMKSTVAVGTTLIFPGLILVTHVLYFSVAEM